MLTPDRYTTSLNSYIISHEPIGWALLLPSRSQFVVYSRSRDVTCKVPTEDCRHNDPLARRQQLLGLNEETLYSRGATGLLDRDSLITFHLHSVMLRS